MNHLQALLALDEIFSLLMRVSVDRQRVQLFGLDAPFGTQ